MPREPRQKGTSVLPVVEALKAHPDRERLVPQRLWKYFEDHLLVSGWYPEQDYFILIEALAKTIDAKTSGGDVEEFGQMVGIELESKVTRSTARGDSHCEWEHILARTAACEAYVASLPPVRRSR